MQSSYTPIRAEAALSRLQKFTTDWRKYLTEKIQSLGTHPRSGQAVSDAFRSLRFALLWVGVVSMLINILMLTGPVFMLQIYDRILASGSVPTLLVIGSIALVLYLFMGVFETIRGRMLVRVGQSLDAQLTGRAYSLSTELPLKGREGRRHLRPVEDLDNVRQFFSGPGPAALFDIPWLPLYLAIVFMFHSLLGFTALAGAVVICLLAGLNDLTSRRPNRNAAAMSGRRQQLIDASRRNAETIGAMNMTDALRAQWTDSNSDFLIQQRQASDRSVFFSASIKTVRFVLQSAILAVGAWLAIRQEISPGMMIAASIMTSRALAPVEQAVAQWRSFTAARHSLKKLNEAIAGADDADRRVDLPLPRHDVRLEEIYCAPGDTLRPVVQGVSCTLRAGDGLGIIGPSGSAKSTLAKAIVGIVPLLRGSVRFDGSELGQWSPGRIGEIIGYLPQDSQLFDGSIATNIARFDPQATSRDIIEAAKLADVHDLIVSFPDGYDTVIGAGGMTLSAGHRQRIALARAFYRHPFLVVLDEPNANLDACGERALAEAVRALRSRGSIVIVVAHCPRAVSAVDRILCLKEGRVAGLGPKGLFMNKVIRPAQLAGAA